MIENIGNNTFIHNDDLIETVVGDEKQSEFFPRVKIKKWDC